MNYCKDNFAKYLNAKIKFKYEDIHFLGPCYTRIFSINHCSQVLTFPINFIYYFIDFTI